MKKTFQFLALAFAALCFTACEDVPAPYNIFSEGAGQGTGSHLPYTVTFESSLGDFTTENTVGDFPWTCQHSCAQITSYIDTDGDGTKENNPATSWLISPAFDLTGVEAAHVSFDYILRYANASDLATNYQVLVSKDYTKDAGVAAASWTVLPLDLVQVSDWDTWTNTGNLNIPAEFCNTANVTIALRYIAQAKAATWEVKNFVLDQGAGDQGAGDNGGGSGEEGGVKTLPYSEEFSTTLGGFKNYTTSGEGAWTIDYSTAKATGYDNASKVTTAGTYYLVSPEISLAGQTAVHVSYEYILRYNKGDENQQVFITDAFNEANPAEGWTLLVDKHTEGTDWTTFAKEDIAIPAAYLGKTVRIAFRYNTNAESGSTWEVKNFAIAAGAPGEGGNTGGEGGGSVDTPITNDYITVTAASFGLENQAAVTELKLSDGTTLTFDGGGNNNAPKYYTTGNTIRMYPKNSMTVKSSKKILSIVMTVDVFSGVTYNASGDISIEPGTVSLADDVIKFTGINALQTTITNTSGQTGAASQIRFKKIVITYAE